MCGSVGERGGESAHVLRRRAEAEAVIGDDVMAEGEQW